MEARKAKAGPALEAGIAWKRTVLQQRLTDTALDLLRHIAANPMTAPEVPAYHSLLTRYAGELDTLDDGGGPAWDLVKHNLEIAIAAAQTALDSLTDYFDHNPIWPNGSELRRLREKIAHLQTLLNDLLAEGRP